MPSILPLAETQFTDQNGVPLALGTVEFYIPNTLTPKDTYQDQAASILNTNPVALDAGGRALIWGNGSYRQIVRDSLANLVWDKITSEPAFSPASAAPNRYIVAVAGNTYTLSPAPQTSFAEVYLDGRLINPTGNYTLAGATLTFILTNISDYAELQVIYL